MSMFSAWRAVPDPARHEKMLRQSTSFAWPEEPVNDVRIQAVVDRALRRVRLAPQEDFGFGWLLRAPVLAGFAAMLVAGVVAGGVLVSPPETVTYSPVALMLNAPVAGAFGGAQ